MAGAFSGHLLDSHNTSFNSPLVTHGAMSFNPMMHGTPYAQNSFSLFSQPSFNPNESISEETAKKIATLQVKLNQKLGPEYISQRPGPGGGPKLTYVEGWKIINLANEVFGFNGWSSSIVSMNTDFADYNEETRRYNVGVTALMRVTLKDGVYHEDIGYGMLENSKSKGAALDKCKKEAVTDGLKRALRNFGNVMGNCLYDKIYAQEVVKVKFEPAKFNKDELHRRIEFQDAKISITSTNSSSTVGPSNQNVSRTSYPNHNAVATPTRLPVQQSQATAMTSLPAHIRSELSAASTNSNKGKAPMHPPHGLNTPITTPLQQQPQAGRLVSDAESSGSKASNQIARPAVKAERSEDDDSFGFGSEDDAFLALADLGPSILNAHEADMGRPIETETDMGRPIDHEGLLASEEAEDDGGTFARHPADTSGRRLTPLSSKNDPTAAKTRQEIMEAALRGDPINNAASKPSASAPRQMQPPSILKTSATSSTTNSSSSATMCHPPPQTVAQQTNQNTRTTSFGQQQHQRYVQNRQNQSSNPNPIQQNQNQPVASSTASEGVRRAPTPSVGGFNFPPGVNLLNKENGAIPLSVGFKRPAEAIGKSSNYRGGRAGMGLQQAVASLNQGPPGRQVLGSLDISNGGDVKRPRLS